MLISGSRHLATERDAAGSWDGRWQVSIVQSRGKDHRERYRLRTSMLLGGLGYLGNGIWISPSGQLRDEIVAALTSEPGLTLTMLRSKVEPPESAEFAQRAYTHQVVTQEVAEREHFIGSQTIRVDGRDILPPGEAAQPALTCRRYRRRDGRPGPLPDPDAIRDALERALSRS